MRLQEFTTALEAVQTEFPKFDLSTARLARWYKSFGKHSLKTWTRIVEQVLRSSRYAPQQADFCAAESAVLGGRREEYRFNPEDVAAYKAWLDAIEPKKRMDVIIQAKGYQWVNEQLGLSNARMCLDFCAQFGVGGEATGESISHQQRYKAWKEKSFKAAWKKLNGEEPSAEMLAQYE